MPEILLKGMLGLALQLSWYRWAAATAVIFMASLGREKCSGPDTFLLLKTCWSRLTAGFTSGLASQKAGEELRRFNTLR